MTKFFGKDPNKGTKRYSARQLKQIQEDFTEDTYTPVISAS